MSKLKDLENLLTHGKITRREFLARATALGLTAAMSPALMSIPAQAATPKKGGRFRIGTTGGSTTDSMDPGTITDNMMQQLNYMTRNNLVEINHKSEPIPELAESWEASADAAEWIFKLRKGVEFHNGKTMDAEDVIFSFRHHMGEDSKSAAKSILEAVQDIKADGKHTVIFKLEGGNADFPYIASDYHITIMPNETSPAEMEKGVGTGGYILESHEPGVRAFVKRNPNYFKADRAHFDEIEVNSIPDVNARTNAIKTGQVDAINRCEKKTFKLLSRSPNIQPLITTGTKHYTFAMLCDLKPYDNLDVRLAVKYAIDRKQFVKTILRGYGVPGNDHPIGAANRYYASELPQRNYDPEKVKFHLKKAGMQDYTFPLHTADAGFPGAVDAAVLLKESAAKAGMNFKVIREPNDGYWSNVWLKKPMCAVFWGGRPTEDWMFSTAYAAGAPWNDSHWNNKKFDELLVAARAELDEAKRREMYVEMQSICRDDGGVAVLAFVSDLHALGKNVRFDKDKVAANWEWDGLRHSERWWFES